jgi:response regulator of citrate/malate metabolism
MGDWRVLVVDDDPTTASIHLRIVASQPGFSVVAVASSGEEAMAVLKRGVPIDLILLDVELPGANGAMLLRALRVHGGPEVIAVTAVRDPKVVQNFIHLGVVDYLVKPFPIERLQVGLLRFRDRMRTLGSRDALEQQEIDRLYSNPERNLLPRGLRQETLDAVRSTLRLGGERFSSAEDVAATAAVARVTARRYLEYLVSSRQAETDTLHDGPGRPRKLYRLTTLPS